MTIDKQRNLLYVAGASGGKWAVARLNIDTIRTTPEAWKSSILTGTANALWLDSTDGYTDMGVAGTNSSGQIQMAKLYAMDTRDFWGNFHAGGTFDTEFAGTGYAAAPNTIYGVPAPYTVTASASAIFEGDDVGMSSTPNGGEEWFISGTVTYCCSSYTPSSGSDMVIVDFFEDGTLAGAGWGNGNGATPLYNTCNNCVVGSSQDSNYAMVPNADNDTITLVGTNGSVLTERFVASTGMRDTSYGPLVGGGPERKGWAVGPSGVGYAAVLDPGGGGKVIVSGSGGSNDFLAVRFNDVGALDTSFGSGGSIRIDFGSTSGNTTDGARSMAIRTLDGGTTFDILLGGYTYDAATGKYKIALVDLLADNTFDVS